MFHLLLTLVRLYSYDAVGRRTGEIASDGSSVTMGYSLAGSIASMTTADSGSCARVQVAAGVAGEVAGISSLASGWIPVVMDPTAEVPTVVGVGEMPVPTPGVSMLGASASGDSGLSGVFPSSSVLAGGAGGSRELSKYTMETAPSGTFNFGEAAQKTGTGMAKDAVKSSVKTAVKMDKEDAAYYRSTAAFALKNPQLTAHNAVQGIQTAATKASDSLQIAAIKVQNYDYSQLVTPPILR